MFFVVLKCTMHQYDAHLPVCGKTLMHQIQKYLPISMVYPLMVEIHNIYNRNDFSICSHLAVYFIMSRLHADSTVTLCIHCEFSMETVQRIELHVQHTIHFHLADSNRMNFGCWEVVCFRGGTVR